MNKFYFQGYLSSKSRQLLKKTFLKFDLKIVFNKDTNLPCIKLVDEILNPKNDASSATIGYADLKNNIAYVKYPFSEPVKSICFPNAKKIQNTNLFVLTCLHEALHLIGINHCSSPKCVMAKLNCKSSKSGYCLSCLSTQRQIPNLCPICKKQILLQNPKLNSLPN